MKTLSTILITLGVALFLLAQIFDLNKLSLKEEPQEHYHYEIDTPEELLPYLRHNPDSTVKVNVRYDKANNKLYLTF